MPSAAPGGQHHTGHRRRAVVPLPSGGRVNAPPLSPFQRVLGEFKEPVGPRPYYLLFIHPWTMPSSNSFIY